MSSTNLSELPKDLPRPVDDGAANHLRGMSLPKVAFQATNDAMVDLASVPARVVIYIYPMTGRTGGSWLHSTVLQLPGSFCGAEGLEYFRVRIEHTDHGVSERGAGPTASSF